MRSMPLDIGCLHFVGIGGIGMSGIAEVMHNLGYTVRGSDQARGSNVERLEDLGIKIVIGHSAENIEKASVVVISSAIKSSNPEIKAARMQLIPVVQRAEMLAEVMRLKWSIAVGGTHGKTTTTSMIAALLDAADIDPTVINGGILNAYGSNARLGKGDWMVVEADESDGTFVRLPATIATVTNIDPEHLDYYGDFDGVRDAFKSFIENIPFYGAAILCLDHPEVQALINRITDCRIITYGIDENADFRALNIKSTISGSQFDICVRDRINGNQFMINDLFIPMLGRHNVLNALAAISVTLEMGIEKELIKKGLSEFKGVDRRFTKVGEVNGISIIDDYAHHPIEIISALRAAREVCKGNIIAVVQPHRFSRVKSLFVEFCSCFDDADIVVVSDIFPAGEVPIKDINKESLISGLHDHGHKSVHSLSDPDDLPSMIDSFAQSGDFIVLLGAGTITNWAQSLPSKLQKISLEASALGK